MTSNRPLLRSASLLAILAASLPSPLRAACDDCPKPSVALYDLDVQVPVDTSAAGALAEWWKLHFAAGWVAGTVGEDPCSHFIDGALFQDTSGSPSRSLAIGPGHAHLPPSGPLPLASHDYLLYGSVSKPGEAYRMDLKLETTCSREVAASVSGSFASPSEASQTAVRLSTQAFTPLSSKIREFERQKRASNPKVAIDICKDAFQILPSKSKANPSETFPVTISLKDCDGTPLAGRQILLMGGTFKGSALAPSTNGVFTEATATTNGEGKVTVDYTTGPGKGLSVARAHFVYESPAGCGFESEAMAAIDVQGTAAHYEVKFDYTESYLRHLDTTVALGASTQRLRVDGFSDLSLSGTAIVANDPVAVAEGTIDFSGPAPHAALTDARYRAWRYESDRQILTGAGADMAYVSTRQQDKQGASAIGPVDRIEVDFVYDPADPANSGSGGISVPMKYSGRYRDFKSEYASAAGVVTKDTSSVVQREDSSSLFVGASAPTGKVVESDSAYRIDVSRSEDFLESGNIAVRKSSRLRMTISPLAKRSGSVLRDRNTGLRGSAFTVVRSGPSWKIQLSIAHSTGPRLRFLDQRGRILAEGVGRAEADGWIHWTPGSTPSGHGRVGVLQVIDGTSRLQAPILVP